MDPRAHGGARGLLSSRAARRASARCRQAPRRGGHHGGGQRLSLGLSAAVLRRHPLRARVPRSSRRRRPRADGAGALRGPSREPTGRGCGSASRRTPRSRCRWASCSASLGWLGGGGSPCPSTTPRAGTSGSGSSAELALWPASSGRARGARASTSSTRPVCSGPARCWFMRTSRARPTRTASGAPARRWSIVPARTAGSAGGRSISRAGSSAASPWRWAPTPPPATLGSTCAASWPSPPRPPRAWTPPRSSTVERGWGPRPSDSAGRRAASRRGRRLDAYVTVASARSRRAACELVVQGQPALAGVFVDGGLEWDDGPQGLAGILRP